MSEHIVEHAANHARQIERYIESYGTQAVEQVLDAALSLEQYVDVDQPLRRARYPEYAQTATASMDDKFRARYSALEGSAPPPLSLPLDCARPCRRIPSSGLLWFMATYAPEMEDWERDIFLAVREESFYFYPVYATQIMNEGWASYWHARLLREADFIPQSAYLDAIKCHSDVVRPIAAGQQAALAINPYHVGFSLWEKIVSDAGMEVARTVMRQDDDFSFIRNQLTQEAATSMELFRYRRQDNGQIKVASENIDALRECVLQDRYNFGAPRVSVTELRPDGTLVLQHDNHVDGRGLDPERARKVLEYLHRMWRRPVVIRTVDAALQAFELSVPTSGARRGSVTNGLIS